MFQPGQRILVFLNAESYAQAEEMIRDATEQALLPKRLSFGLSLPREPDESEKEAMTGVGVRWKVGDETAIRSMPAMWRGETWAFSVNADLLFRKGWDAGMILMLKKLAHQGVRQALLTCFPPADTDWLQSCRPVAGASVSEDGSVSCGPGMPLRFATTPQRSAMLHPQCCFAPAAFFRQMAESEGPLYLRAFRHGWRPYTPHQVWFQTIVPSEAPVFEPVCGEEEQDWLKRLDRLYDTAYGEKRLTGAARQGIHTKDLSWRKRVGVRESVLNVVRTIRHHRQKLRPLFVTCRLAGDQSGWSGNDAARYGKAAGVLNGRDRWSKEEISVFFRMLSDVKKLILLCYADPESMREVELKLPNVTEFRESCLLQLKRAIKPVESERRIGASQMQMLLRSREKVPGMTHWIWIDPDTMRWPVPPNTELMTERICTDRIVLRCDGDGTPDPSVIVVPETLLSQVCREIEELCEQEIPERDELWRKLIDLRPEWFRTIRTPVMEELFR